MGPGLAQRGGARYAAGGTFNSGMRLPQPYPDPYLYP